MSEVDDLLRTHESDKSCVFVFPSEVAADWMLKHLLADRGQEPVRDQAAVPRGKCISWDRFKEETLVPPESLSPANSMSRTLFLEDLLAANRKSPLFRELIAPEHAASSGAHLPFLKRILPLIGQTERLLAQAGKALTEGKRADLSLLATRYRKFLRDAKLYEPDDLDPVFHPGAKHYVIFHTEVIEDWDAVAPLFRGRKTVRAAQPEPAVTPPALAVYAGLEEEIDALMRRIHELLEAGIDPSHIAVTAAGLDEIALPLADSARRFDLRLVINAGRPLTEYPGANLLTQAMETVDSRYDLRALETLLNNRSVPWKDQAAAITLLSFGLENNCLKNYDADGRPFDLWEHHLRRRRGAPGLDAAAALYRSLRMHFTALTTADSFASVKKAFTKFRAVMLDTERLGERERRCLDLALDKLDELDETARALPLPSPASPCRVWLDCLGETHYVPPAREPGIHVYPYRVSAGIRPDHHFLINACEEATRIVLPPLPFLAADEQARLGIADRDISDAFLSLYLVSGRSVTTSCSRQGFGRVRLPPPFFVKQAAIAEATGIGAESDGAVYTDEERYFLQPDTKLPRRLFALQKTGLAAAARWGQAAPVRFTASPVAPAELRQAVIAALTDEDGFLVLSPTDLDRFASCPFGFLLQKAGGLTEEENVFAQEKNLWRGNFIHAVFERFFTELKTGRGRFERAAATRLETEILAAADEEAARWERSRALPLPPLWHTLYDGMRRGFAAFIAPTVEAFDDFEITAVEEFYSVRWEDEKIALSGKIDLVGRSEEGLIVIDYKANKVPTKSEVAPAEGEPASLQIPCYIILAGGSGPPVAAASYYSFKNEQYSHVLHPKAKAYLAAETIAQAVERTRQRILAVAGMIRAGDFTIGERGPAACDGCSLRPVCRRKYFLRLETT
jgi:RecB family exonuclease